MKYLLVCISLSTVFFTAQKAFALREVVFKNEVKVYAEQNVKSEVIGIYNRNDKIPISKEKYGAWRKVIVDYNGKKRIGWFRVSEAKGAKIRTTQEADAMDPNKPKVYKRQNGAGILGALSYVHQTGGDVGFQAQGTDFNLDYDSASGINFYFGFFGDFNLSAKTALRAYLTMRNMERSGDGKIVQSGVTREFRLEQEMITLGATLKWYKDSNAQFWWGPGLEVGKSSDFKIISDKPNPVDPEISVDVKDDPTYIFASLNMGYDMHIAGSFFLLPELKLTVVPNGDPIIANLEIWIPVSYSF